MQPIHRRRSIVREPGPPPRLTPAGIALRIVAGAVLLANALWALFASSDAPHHDAITAMLAFSTLIVFLAIFGRRLAAGDQEERGSWSRRGR